MAPLIRFPLIAFDPSSTKIGWALFGPGPTYIASHTALVADTPEPDHRIVHVGPVVQSIINQACPVRPRTALIEIPDFIPAYAKPHIVRFYRAVGVAEYVAHVSGLTIHYIAASKSKAVDRKVQGKHRFYSTTGRHPLTDDESDAFCFGWDFIASLQPQQHDTSVAHQGDEAADWEEYVDGDPDGY